MRIFLTLRLLVIETEQLCTSTIALFQRAQEAIDAPSAFERTPLAAVPTGMRSLKVGDDANELRCIRREIAYSSKGVSSR